MLIGKEREMGVVHFFLFSSSLVDSSWRHVSMVCLFQRLYSQSCLDHISFRSTYWLSQSSLTMCALSVFCSGSCYIRSLGIGMSGRGHDLEIQCLFFHRVGFFRGNSFFYWLKFIASCLYAHAIRFFSLFSQAVQDLSAIFFEN